MPYADFQLEGTERTIRVRTKVWLEVDGKRLIGQGRATLLRLIQDTSSINAAAREMGISFRRAWSMVRDMEETIGSPLVDKKRGGVGGGEARLTPVAFRLLERYESIRRQFEASCGG